MSRTNRPKDMKTPTECYKKLSRFHVAWLRALSTPDTPLLKFTALAGQIKYYNDQLTRSLNWEQEHPEHAEEYHADMKLLKARIKLFNRKNNQNNKPQKND